MLGIIEIELIPPPDKNSLSFIQKDNILLHRLHQQSGSQSVGHSTTASGARIKEYFLLYYGLIYASI